MLAALTDILDAMTGEEQASQGGGRILGRYVVFDEIATGGMATIHLGRQVGAVGFSRTVAIKRLHAQFAKDPDFVAMFLDEARIAARVRHPNVVPTIDVVSEDGELFLVMEYVQGQSLSLLIKASLAQNVLPPPPVIASIVAGILHGLHAAHEAKSERGEPLHIIHRDVSPQNVIVGVDGVARLLDFGVAKAAERSQTTQAGQVKGKVAYMSPEQLTTDHIDHRTDVYAAGVVLWEALTGLRLYAGANDGRIVNMILAGKLRPPSESIPDLDPIFDEVVLKALAPDPANRYQTAREMALALENGAALAMPSRVGAWVDELASDILEGRAGRIAEIESRSDVYTPPPGGSGVARRSAPEARPSGPSIPAPVPSAPVLAAPIPIAPPSMPSAPAPAPVPSAPPSMPSAPPPVASAPPPVPSGPQFIAPTSSASLPPTEASGAHVALRAEPMDAEEAALARRGRWKKPLAIVAGVLALAATIAIIIAATSTVTPTAAADAAPQPTSTPSTAPAAPPPTTRASSTPTSTAVAPPTGTSKKTPPKCNPPYTTDSKGVRHPKAECL
jgi:serine/threonine-protein kinase